MFSNRTVCVAAAMALSGCGGGDRDRRPGPEDRSTPVKVQTATVSEIEWPESFEAPGTVRARTAATLASRTMGYIREVRFREGDRVAFGDVVVTLEARELRAAAQQARAARDETTAAIPEADGAVASAAAQLALAETTLGRMRDLLDKRSVSRQEFDEAEARVRVARSAKEMADARRRQIDQRVRQAREAVAAADIQLEYLEVKAPFAGRITARRAEPGMLASPGLPLVEVEREGGYRLEAVVSEARAAAIRTGQTAEVRLGDEEKAGIARVEEVAPEIDPASRSLLVKLALPARADLRAGLFGRARFRTGARRVLAVPRDAVAVQGQLRNVLVIGEAAARLRIIRIGEERDGLLEVLAGLAAGERVVSPRPADLLDGARVLAP